MDHEGVSLQQSCPKCACSHTPPKDPTEATSTDICSPTPVLRPTNQPSAHIGDYSACQQFFDILKSLSTSRGQDGCASEDKLGRSGTRMNIPWDPVDEQRLLAYKKEGKSWKWIFRKLPGRTQPAVRTRLTIVQSRGE
jgi:hypothetical protein